MEKQKVLFIYSDNAAQDFSFFADELKKHLNCDSLDLATLAPEQKVDLTKYAIVGFGAQTTFMNASIDSKMVKWIKSFKWDDPAAIKPDAFILTIRGKWGNPPEHTHAGVAKKLLTKMGLICTTGWSVNKNLSRSEEAVANLTQWIKRTLCTPATTSEK